MVFSDRRSVTPATDDAPGPETEKPSQILCAATEASAVEGLSAELPHSLI